MTERRNELSAASSCGAWIMHEGPCVLAKGHDGHHSDGRPEDRPATVVHNKREPFDVYIGRPSKWGNPFSHKDGTLAEFRVASRDEAVDAYAEWIKTQADLLDSLPELRGKVLGCWCAPQRCHGDVLAAMANG